MWGSVQYPPGPRMYYPQYNMYRPQWGYQPTTAQQPYLSCMHEEQNPPWTAQPYEPDWCDPAPPPEPALPPSPPHRPPPARSPYEWMKKPSYQSQPNPECFGKVEELCGIRSGSDGDGTACGKTRTKDKYRVVYTDHQRLELEKEFHYSRYITIRRKAELATSLGLSERQVKIWFQNRRAKERKQVKKREELIHKEKMQQLAML